MNEYAKAVLPKVSQWEPMFKKELIKCIQWAGPEEWFELRNWCYDSFYELYPEVLNEAFSYYSSGKNINLNHNKNCSQFPKEKVYA